MITPPALADCPIDMEYNDLLDCIVVEGSGASFPQKSVSDITIDQGERE